MYDKRQVKAQKKHATGVLKNERSGERGQGRFWLGLEWRDGFDRLKNAEGPARK